MKIPAVIGLLLFSVFSGLNAEELPVKVLSGFSPGLVTEQDSSSICDTCAQDMENVDIKRGFVEKRKGSLKQNSTTIGGFTQQAIRFQHEYVDSSNNRWMLIVTSNSLYGSRDAGATSTLLTSTHGITSSSRFAATNAYGNCYLVDGTTNAIIFNGTVVTASTIVPRGNTIEFFGERLLVGGVAGADGTLYASAVGLPLKWTNTTGLDNDAFSTQIRQQSGYPIRCVKRFRSGVMVFQDRSIDYLTLSGDGLTFLLTPVSSRIGTTFKESVVSQDNVVRWLSYDGFYEFNGTSLVRISEPIQPSIENLAQLASVGRSYTESSQASFLTGFSTGTTAYIESGAVHLSTWTDVDTSSTNFVAGTISNLTTTTVNGALYLSVSNTDIANQSFENGSGVTPTSWTITDTGIRTSTWTAAQAGSFVLDGGGGTCTSVDQTASAFNAISVYNATGTLVTSVSLTPTTSYVQHTIPLSSYVGQNLTIRLNVRASASGAPPCGLVTTFEIARSEAFLSSGQDMTFYVKAHDTTRVAFDNFQNGVSTITSGSLLSRTFDTALDNPKWLATGANFSANGNTVLFETQTSSDSTTFDSLVTWSTGSAPTSSQKRYIRYKVTFTTAATSSGLPFLSDATLGARQQNGNYYSGYAQLTGFTSWGPFLATDDPASGSLTYVLYVDTDTNRSFSNHDLDFTTVVASQTITSGATPVVTGSSSRYAFVASSFVIASSSLDPALYDLTINWNEGNPSLFPVAIGHDLDYLCALSVSSLTANDTIFIYDSNRAWSKYTGLPAYYMSIYGGYPFIGSNEQGDIIRFQVNNHYLDYDGDAISSFWISKDFDFGFPFTRKSVLRYYITAGATTNTTMGFSYGVERGSLTATVQNLNTFSGFYRNTIRPSSITYSEGTQHRFKIHDSTSNETFKVFSVGIKANVLTTP